MASCSSGPAGDRGRMASPKERRSKANNKLTMYAPLPNARKLQGVEDGWRWRVGVCRILGVVDGERLIIEGFRVGDRRDVCRCRSD